MTLIHSSNSPFNLIVSRQSRLAQLILMEELNINPEENELETLKKQHEELKTKHSKCLIQIETLKDEIHKIKNEPNND